MEDFTTQGNLDEILASPDFKHFLYPADLFQQRLKEEFLRTNRNGRPFTLIKIYVHQFDIFSDWNKTAMAIRSWKISVLTLLAELKFIDVIGFLPDGGLGLILLNANIESLSKIQKDILRNLHDAQMIDVLRFHPKRPIFEAFVQTGTPEAESAEEEKGIEAFNKNAQPFFKLSRLHYADDVLPKTAGRAYRAFMKRFIDVSCVSLALIVLSPILLFCALAVKLSDPKGPIIFKQTRVGKNGKLFTMFKFRSMYVDAEERKKELMKFNETSGPTFKMKNDPRIYPLGRVLRKFSLDELPQLINILRGDMSIVGPRPPLPSETITYAPWHNMRLSVTPGLTCIWQVSGRSNISFEDWMRLDNQYVREPSLRQDIGLIAKTFKVVFKGDGAY